MLNHQLEGRTPYCNTWKS